MHRLHRHLLLLVILAAVGCDRGLAPPEPTSITSLSGQVHFEGVLPPCDSVKALAVVVSQAGAPFSVQDIINNINKTIFAVTLDACSFTDTSFSFVLPPNTYRYLGVAQLYGDSITHDWRIVGFAHTANDSAISYTLTPGKQVSGIVLNVRFDSLPWQPFIQ